MRTSCVGAKSGGALFRSSFCMLLLLNRLRIHLFRAAAARFDSLSIIILQLTGPRNEIGHAAGVSDGTFGNSRRIEAPGSRTILAD
jgi:hypothetical protein